MSMSHGIRALWCTVALYSLLSPLIAARAAEPIVLGLSLGVAGSATDDGSAWSIQAVTEAFVDQVNGKGGVLGRPLKLVILRNGEDPRRAGEQARALVRDHGATALLSCVGDAVCQAMAEVAGELKVPLVGPMAGSRALARGNNPYVFRLRPGYERESAVLAKQLGASGISRIALISDLPEGERTAAFREGLRKEGLKVTMLPITGTTRSDFEALLKRLGDGGDAAAIFDLKLPVLSRLLEERLDARPEWPATLVPVNSASRSVMMGAFRHRMIGYASTVPDPENPALAVANELQRLAQSSGSVVVTPASFEAYLNAKLLIEAIARARRAEPAAIAGALEAMRDMNLGGFFVSFAHGRSSGSNLVVVQIRPRSGK